MGCQCTQNKVKEEELENTYLTESPNKHNRTGSLFNSNNQQEQNNFHTNLSSPPDFLFPNNNDLNLQNRYPESPETKEFQTNTLNKNTNSPLRRTKKHKNKHEPKNILDENSKEESDMKSDTGNSEENKKEGPTPEDPFSKYIFIQINKIREDPKFLIPIIKEEEKNITKETVTRNDLDEERFIYRGKASVALHDGVSAFENTISILNNTEPMEPLEYAKEITVPPPDNEEEILDKDYLKSYIRKINGQGNYVNSFWRDIVREQFTSFLLMIVDDTGKKAGARRSDILNPNYKYIGISSKKVKKAFACYVTFGK